MVMKFLSDAEVSARSAELKARYPKGTVVRVKPDMLDGWSKAISAKLTDRLGEVVTNQFPGGTPVIAFHAVGRRSLLRMPFIHPERYLDIVTDEVEIRAWREAVQKAEELQKLRALKKRTR
jgi:hypothetical protein